RLRVPLSHDDTAQPVSELSGYLGPDRLTLEIAEADLFVGRRRDQEDAPAVLGHPDIVEVRPAAWPDRDPPPQVERVVLGPARAHFEPPAQEVGLPGLERSLEAAILAEVDVVGNLVVKLGRHGHVLVQLKTGRSGRP